MPVETFGPFGGVFLDGVQFSTDPEPYKPLQWAKRYSVHMGIGGAVTYQDFGIFAKDNMLHLASGATRFLEESVMLALHSRYRTKGVAFSFSDWLNNGFTVFIKDFYVDPWMKGISPSGGTISLYTYTMDLQVVSMTQFVGQAYTGL